MKLLYRKEPLERQPSLGVSWYLTASYCYYLLDKQVMSDSEFDELGQFLLKHYNEITHRHKHLITIEDLKAGSLLLAEEDYPSIVKASAKMFVSKDFNWVKFHNQPPLNDKE